jgi:guanylate cyclase
MKTRLANFVAHFGIEPGDDDETRLKKSLLVICALPFMLAGVVWGLMYFVFGERLAGAIPFSYACISLLSIIYFGLTRRYAFFRFSQLTLILLLPFFLMLALGGFINGSAVVMWAIICPFGALLFDEHRRAPIWFLAFVGLVILSGLLQPYLRPANHLSPALILFLFSMNLIGVGSIVFWMIYYFVGQKNLFQERSEQLLLNILPREIAAILKNEQRTIADHYDGASILFADMVNFTPLTASLPPAEMVELLNEVFSYFDTLVEKYNVEKIRTIGDSYMVASGVPRLRPDHAQALAHMALEMRAYVNSHTFKNGRALDFRIGLNSGPLIAGVIGRKKFIYDIWGDAVNTASRMESHGAAGQIQISRNTYELIKDDFICESRGAINIKGKGEMEVWYVVGVK